MLHFCYFHLIVVIYFEYLVPDRDECLVCQTNTVIHNIHSCLSFNFVTATNTQSFSIIILMAVRIISVS